MTWRVASRRFPLAHGLGEDGVLEEGPVAQREIDPKEVLGHHAPRAER